MRGAAQGGAKGTVTAQRDTLRQAVGREAVKIFSGRVKLKPPTPAGGEFCTTARKKTPQILVKNAAAEAQSPFPARAWPRPMAGGRQPLSRDAQLRWRNIHFSGCLTHKPGWKVTGPSTDGKPPASPSPIGKGHRRQPPQRAELLKPAPGSSVPENPALFTACYHPRGVICVTVSFCKVYERSSKTPSASSLQSGAGYFPA